MSRVVITHVEQFIQMLNEVQMHAEGYLEDMPPAPVRLEESVTRAALRCLVNDCVTLSNEVTQRFQRSVEFGESIGEDPLPTTVIIYAHEVETADRILAAVSTWALDYGYQLAEKE